MKRIHKKSLVVSVSIAAMVVISAAVLAVDEDNEDPFMPKGFTTADSMFSMPLEWNIYGGASIATFPDGSKNGVSVPSTYVSPGETDYLVQTSDSTSTGVAAGFDAVWMFANSDHTKVRGISLGFMYETGPATFKGYVNSTFTGSPGNYVNYNYTYSAKPSDFALDANFYPVEIHALHLLPYVTVGGGVSSVGLTYNQIPLPNSEFNPVSAGETVTTPLALVGLGLRCNPAKHFFMKVQYLYHYRGSETLSNSQFQSAPSVKLNSHSFDFLAGVRLP